MTDLFVFVVKTMGLLRSAMADCGEPRMVMFSPRCTIGSALRVVNLRKEVNVNDNFFTEFFSPLTVLIRD
ncbi:hypothetical protein TH1_02040 [Thalassospira lucentensis MCCC 1A00383 = DSM 14000]|uniref:Uncharacterized protein n=2 Tax=Thalassospira TaxID=168934 RepID=A0A358HX88_9PROT|nr:hypothetical protein COO92_00475 [Thalassospira lohafexi]RCK30722.1 hypothetical protein TH1_02040 [Thalassospira lucentensis MCCC 1A00383 = DSM 14000]HBU99787.1 hypothetical protein [Thalassospira lucentensis]